MKFEKHRSIFLIDFEDVFFDVKFEIERLAYKNNITHKKDLYVLFVYEFLNKTLNFYDSVSKSGCFPIFFIAQGFLDKLLNIDVKKNLVNYPKFIKDFIKKMKFNVCIKNISYKNFYAELQEDDFLYDETLEKVNYLSTIMPNVCVYIKKMGFFKLEKVIVEDLHEQLRLCGALATTARH